MNEKLNLVIGLAMGLNLVALGSSRLPSVIRAAAVQHGVPCITTIQAADAAVMAMEAWPRRLETTSIGTPAYRDRVA